MVYEKDAEMAVKEIEMIELEVRVEEDENLLGARVDEDAPTLRGDDVARKREKPFVTKRVRKHEE